MNDDKKSVHRIRDVLNRSRRNYAELLSVTAELVQAKEENIQNALTLLNSLPMIPSQAWTISSMRRQFTNFSNARKHFQSQYGIKANNWNTLVERVNIVEYALVHLGLNQRSQDE